MIDPKAISVTETKDAKNGWVEIRARLDVNSTHRISEQSINASWVKQGELVEIAKRDCRRKIMNELYGELRNDFHRLSTAIRYSRHLEDIPEVDKVLESIAEKLNY